MRIVEAHGDVYAATASPAYPQDLKKKMKKAKNAKKPAFIHVQCPCPPGWEIQDDQGVAVARLAFETNFFPLYEYDSGVIKVKKPGKKKKPVEAYLKLQGRFSHLTKKQIADIQRYVDQEFEDLLRREAMTKE
jgi:pyruvate ferredoxin oxidoreductase beta subunit